MVQVLISIPIMLLVPSLLTVGPWLSLILGFASIGWTTLREYIGGCRLKQLFARFFGNLYHIEAFCESREARASSVDTNSTRRIDPRHAEGPQIAQLQGNMFLLFRFSTDSLPA